MRQPVSAMIGVFILTGGVFLYALLLLLYGVVKNAHARNWVAIDGQVLQIVEYDKAAKVVYQYEYNDRTYRGDRLTYLDRGSIPERNHILDRYHVGMQLKVAVNPNRPQEAVLEIRNTEASVIGNYVFVLLALAGFMGLVGFSCVRRIAQSRSEIHH